MSVTVSNESVREPLSPRIMSRGSPSRSLSVFKKIQDVVIIPLPVELK